MPIRNMGTLLENIVVVEAMRLLAQGNQEKLPIDFLNSFAMPPQSEWCEHGRDYGFSRAQLNTLRVNRPPAQASSYEGMLRACLQQPLGNPGTQGPNGALLVAMLAHHLTCPLRLWLNDIPNGHYRNGIHGLAKINTNVQQVLGLVAAPENVVVTCDQRWPDSLIPPSPNNLSQTLEMWGSSNIHARLGFLDPKLYRENNPRDSETDSESHQCWLRLLSDGFSHLIISIHFTGNSHTPHIGPAVRQMHQDGLAAGYQRTLISRHAHYRLVCNIKHPDGDRGARMTAAQIQMAIRAAWNNWYNAIGREPHQCDFDVL